MLAVCLAGAVLVRIDPALFRSLRARAGAPGAAVAGRRGPVGQGSGTGGTDATSTTAPTTLSGAGGTTSGGAPVVTSINPSRGPAGTRVRLAGRGFFSANSRIDAFFGGAAAPTSCPSSSLCIATAPPGLAGAVQVRVHTETGSSDAVTFDYSSG